VTRGHVVPIGGAEQKLGEPLILRRFARLCGGRSARIAIIPTASQERDTGKRYEEIFRELGAKHAHALPFGERQDAERPDWLDELDGATGIFLTGGNQLRLATHLGGTAVVQHLRMLNASGVHVAGTSAGAAFLCEHMIAYGDEGPTPREGMVTLAPGLGLTNKLVIDQHFRQRDRLGRLLAALALSPSSIGIGLDEDTAAFVAADDTLEVVGSGALTVVDPSEVEFDSMDQVKKHEPICFIGVKLHVLTHGASYDVDSRSARPATVG
jgi:cyanophycinase